MELTLFFAQFWGWLLVIVGTIFLFRKNALLEELFSLVKDSGFTLISGYLALTLGLATVLLHNVWVADWRVVITIFGWMSVLKGVVRMGFPDIAQKSVSVFKDRPLVIRVLLVICILLGAWLIWMSL